MTYFSPVNRSSPAHVNSTQVDELFKSIAEHSGLQQAVVNIRTVGQYSLPRENFTFSYGVRPTSFENLNRVMQLAQRKPKQNKNVQWNGYLKVHLFSEELSKQMIVFLALVFFGGFEKMRIVAPHFSNGVLRSTVGSTPFHVLFNLDELNRMFADNGYPPIVSDKEYDEACKNAKPIYLISYILLTAIIDI